jgi:antitoxin (DNA-binding transcriptional repressor) of toxin-antitoxin stability system
LAELLDAVSKGERITITRRGTPVATLTPYAEGRPDPDLAISALRRLRKGVTLGGESLRAMIDEGRR